MLYILKMIDGFVQFNYKVDFSHLGVQARWAQWICDKWASAAEQDPRRASYRCT